MRVGFVSFWFTRGQAFVTREIERVVREAGHETFVLARPDKLKGRYRTDGIWAHARLEIASGWHIPRDELLAWAQGNALDVCFFFQNEQFDEIEALRNAGVRTVGTFMWEMLQLDLYPRAAECFDRIYSMHAAHTDLFARHGILAPRIHWGCWPELLGREVAPKPAGEPVRFYYPAGYLEIRRAIEPTIKAFVKGAVGSDARLIVKSTKPVKEKHRVHHPQVEYVADDRDRGQYLDFLRGCDVVLSNTRWEGLGLVLYEALAMGLPIVCPDAPPMSENVRHGMTGLLVPCSTRKTAPSGIPAADTKPRALADAVRRLADRAEVERMSANTLRMRDLDYAWDRTRDEILRLLDDVAG